MNDILGVDGGEGVAELESDLDGSLPRERTFGAHNLVEVPAAKELHDDIEISLRGAPDHIRARYVRVREHGHRASLSLTTSSHLWIDRIATIEEFDRIDRSAYAVDGSIYGCHSALAQAFHDTEAAGDDRARAVGVFLAGNPR